MLNLANVRKINKIEPILDTNEYEKIFIDGWRVIDKKGKYHVNELVVFIEIGSLLPDKKEFEFMRDNNFKVLTRIIANEYSQGLIFKITDILPTNTKYKNRCDVTNILGIKPLYKKNNIGDLPYILNNVKPINIIQLQNYHRLISDKHNSLCFITEQLEGLKVSYILKKNKFYIFDNTKIITDKNTKYWKIAKKIHIKNILKKISKKYNIKDICIQGIIIGEGIKNNKYEISGLDFYSIGVYDISLNNWKYIFIENIKLEINFNLKATPFLSYVVIDKKRHNIEFWENITKGLSNINFKIQKKGIIVRDLDNTFSFRYNNPSFLINYNNL